MRFFKVDLSISTNRAKSMGINQSKPTNETEESMRGYNKRPATHIGAIHQHQGSLRSGRPPLESSERRLDNSTTISTNLPICQDIADDIVSKSTESTEGSPECVDAADIPTAQPLGRPVVWFQRRPPVTSIPATRGRGSMGHFPIHPSPSADDAGPQIDLDRISLKRKSSSLPLKCPPRNRKNPSNFTKHLPDSAQQNQTSSSFNDQDEDNDHLQHLYDMRTWDMYLRITEARRKQTNNNNDVYQKDHVPQNQHPPMQNNAALPPSHIEPLGYRQFSNIEDVEPIPIEIGGSMSGHVMIFGDLE